MVFVFVPSRWKRTSDEKYPDLAEQVTGRKRGVNGRVVVHMEGNRGTRNPSSKSRWVVDAVREVVKVTVSVGMDRPRCPQLNT